LIAVVNNLLASSNRLRITNKV